MTRDRHFSGRDWTAHPPALSAAYRSTAVRAPSGLIQVPQTLTETTGPRFAPDAIDPGEADLIRSGARSGRAVGEPILLHGLILDEDGAPVPGCLIEIWQANAAGRYRHQNDTYTAPLDPNFIGSGRCVSGADGAYAFHTIRPGAYPWVNQANSWRPSHIHVSVLGPATVTRLVTQAYFEGDPLIDRCPIVGAVPRAAIGRMIARFDANACRPFECLAYCFDVVLAGPAAAP